jgi:hypothetical protein
VCGALARLGSVIDKASRLAGIKAHIVWLYEPGARLEAGNKVRVGDE